MHTPYVSSKISRVLGEKVTQEYDSPVGILEYGKSHAALFSLLAKVSLQSKCNLSNYY